MANVEVRQELLSIVPEGVPVERGYLLQKGFSVHALDNFVKSGQLESLAHGVYARPKTNITWQGVVRGLQNFPNRELTVGGLTALEMQGLGHYLALGKKKTVHLFGEKNLPLWASKILPDVTFSYHKTNAFKDFTDVRGGDPITRKVGEALFPFEESGGAHPLIISSPAAAILEVLLDVPEKISFEHADQLMQGLTTLSPRRVQLVLEWCKNVKAKRLFLWLAERNNHAWFKKLDLGKVDLGTGSRSLAKGGKFDSKYKITVPEDMWTKTASTTSKSNF